jgi:single-strand DNA-binding protein
MDSNTLWLRGNLVADPVQRVVASGHKLTNFRLASNTSRRDPTTGAWTTTETLFLSVNCWRQLADNVVRSLHKGDAVEVRGRLRQREYDDKDQNRVVRYELEAYSVTPDLNRAEVEIKRPERLLPAQVGPAESGDANAWTEPVRPSGEEAA